jgi:hypothetical protein
VKPRSLPLLFLMIAAVVLARAETKAEKPSVISAAEPPTALTRTQPHETSRVAGDWVSIPQAEIPAPANGAKSGETFCDGQWQDNGLGAGYYPLWFGGDEFYAAYQDPQTLGSCAGLGDPYDFDVATIRWWVFEQTGGTSYDLQPLVYANAGDASCPAPGGILCAGPVYHITLPQTTSYVLDLPLTAACCVSGPYFAGVYSPTVTGSGHLGLVAAAPSGSATPCRVYNDWEGTWEDLADHLDRDLFLWSEGTAADQNDCPGSPGNCSWQSWHGTEAFYWTDPRGNGETDYFVRFVAADACTLRMARFRFFCEEAAGEPTVRVRVYGSAGPSQGGRLYPDTQPEGANLLGFVDVLYPELECYPAWSYADLTSLGALTFSPSEEFFITVSRSPLTPHPASDTAVFMSDDEFGPLTRSGAWYGSTSDYYYFDEIFGSPRYELQIEAYFCCEIDIDDCPSLTAPTPVGATANAPVSNQVVATDPEGQAVEYFLVSGPGSVGLTSGLWEYTPACADIPGFDVTVEASDRGADACSTATFRVDVAPPPLVPQCGYYVLSVVCAGLAQRNVTAGGGCPPLGYDLISGPGAVDGAGHWSYQSDCLSAPDTLDVGIEIADDAGQFDTCTFMLVVREPIVGPCDCPHQCDFDADGFLTAIDLSGMIDVLFAGSPDIQDPDCPISRSDFDCDNFATALDLVGLIDHLFAGGQPPCDLCGGP